jgi:PadR family transcriptional regulator PadR
MYRMPEHRTQVLKGVLDVCLLALISEEPSYGYEMVEKLADRGLPLVADGSIYPSLSRLQNQGLAEGYFEEHPGGGGPPRKYYRITAEGAERLAEWTTEWRELSHGVSRVLEGGRADG